MTKCKHKKRKCINCKASFCLGECDYWCELKGNYEEDICQFCCEKCPFYNKDLKLRCSKHKK